MVNFLFSAILTAMFVTIATVKVKLISDLYTLAIVLINQQEVFGEKRISFFGPHRDGGGQNNLLLHVALCDLKNLILTHLNEFYMFPRYTIRKDFTFIYNLVFEHSDTLLFALLACIILHMNGKLFGCSVFTFVQYINHTAITDGPETTTNGLVNRCILLIKWISLCPFYQKLYSPVEKDQKYAKIPSNYRKIQQRHQVENFAKTYCSFFYPHIEKFQRK